MPAIVSASEDAAVKRAGEIHNEALNAVQSAMSSLSDVTIVSTPIDRDGRPLADPTFEESRDVLVERALEEAHKRRVMAGTAVAAGEEPWRSPVVVTLQSELDGLGMKLGELRAQYLLNERALMAQIEQVATRLELAKEMSK